MGLTIIARFALATTAIAPVGFVLASVACWNGDGITALIAMAVTIFLAAFCMLLLKAMRGPNARSPQQHPITTVDPVDRDNTAIILLYFMPIIMSGFDGVKLTVWIPTLVVFLIVVLTGHGCFFNPLLGIFGWHFYRVGTPENVTRLLISRKTLRKGDQTITGVELGDYIIMETD